MQEHITLTTSTSPASNGCRRTKCVRRRVDRDHFVVARRTVDSALACPWTNGRNMHKYVVGKESDGEMHGQKYGDRICRLTPRQEP